MLEYALHDWPEDIFPHIWGKSAHAHVHAIHLGRDEVLRLLNHNSYFAVPFTQQASVIYVRGANNHFEVVHDHEFAVYIHQLTGLKGAGDNW